MAGRNAFHMSIVGTAPKNIYKWLMSFTIQNNLPYAQVAVILNICHNYNRFTILVCDFIMKTKRSYVGIKYIHSTR